MLYYEPDPAEDQLLLPMSPPTPTSVPDCKTARKSLGAWYTPPTIARPMVEWAIRSPQDQVLDPAAGDGIFLIESARRLQRLGSKDALAGVAGFDISARAASVARTRLQADFGKLRADQIRAADFFSIATASNGQTRRPYDAVIGNPPYVRYQSFSGAARDQALERASEAGVNLSALSSSWAPFVIHAASFVRKGGRLAFVLPEEMLHTQYAGPVRAFLRRSFQTTHVITFLRHVFPESQERVVVLLAEGKDSSSSGRLRVIRLESPAEMAVIRLSLRSADEFAPGAEPAKWEFGLDDPGTKIVERLAQRGLFTPLRDVGGASIGYVSGANDYFVLTPTEARHWSLPETTLIPTVVAARQVRGAIARRGDIAFLKAQDERCLLWPGTGESSSSVKNYIRQGVLRGIPGRYKCRMRSPWYVVPGASVPDALLTYMSSDVPRFALNAARLTCSNNLLAVRLSGVPRPLRPAFVAAFYNSATLLSAERVGRRYGGGVLKLEPSEAGSLLVPSRALLSRCAAIKDLLPSVDALIRARRTTEAVDRIDAALLKGACGLTQKEMEAVRSSHRDRQGLRTGSSAAEISPPANAQSEMSLRSEA